MALFNKKQVLELAVAARIPPGQQLTVKWPVLTYGPFPTHPGASISVILAS